MSTELNGETNPGAGKVDPVKQLDYAKDSVTQVLTLSTATLALSLTFSHNWLADTPDAHTFWLKLAWILLVSGIVLGLWAMLALTGLAVLGQANVYKWSFRLPWLLEVLAFLTGVGSLLVFGWQTVNA